MAQRERDGRDDGALVVEVDEFGRLQTVTESVVSRHETFFSCVQAACYVLCFYGVDAAVQQKNVPTARRRWERVVGCRMQPLRYCLQSVRVEFFRLAEHVGLLGPAVWAAIPTDLLPPGMHVEHGAASSSSSSAVAAPAKPATIPRPGAGTPAWMRPRLFSSRPTNPSPYSRPGAARRPTKGINMGAGYNPLDSFFPYDPCLLRMLHEPIEGAYRTWRGLPGVDDVEVDGHLSQDAVKGDGVDMGTDEEDEDGDDEDEMTQSLSSMLSSAMSR